MIRRKLTRGSASLLALLVLLGFILFLMTSLQTQLLFPVEAVPPPGPQPAGSRQLSIETADGESLKGVHIPPVSSGSERLLILGFGGNAWNASDVGATLHEIFPEADVVAFHYRGYRPSTGSPSTEALIGDAPLVLDEARRLVRPDRTIAVGFSIGSGVAASLAGRRPTDGLILVTPFDSLKLVARDLYPWLPAALLEHEMEPAAFLSTADIPVAIIAASIDEVIPQARTEGLRRSAGRLAFDRTIDEAGHNDLYSRAEFRRAMRQALDAVTAGEGSPAR